MGQTLGFTMDDELAADYIHALQNNDWKSNGYDLKDIDLWWSLGSRLNEYVLKQARFTGCLDETTDMLGVIRMAEFEYLYLQACEQVSNAEGGINGIDEDSGHLVLCYKGRKPFHLIDLNNADWNDYAWAINPRARWCNMINKTGLEWIIWSTEDLVWIRNKSAYDSLIKYTGWSIWKDGKCVGGRPVMNMR
jgi:hypothetical protein